MKISGNDIIHLKRKDIDIQKWDSVIQNSINSRLYARSLWLDIVSPGWEALIMGDYEYLVPLTVKKKYGISYLAQPLFTQQLGVFSHDLPEEGIIHELFSRVRSLYAFAEIAVNFQTDSIAAAVPRKNYCIELNTEYPELQANYRGKLIYAVKAAAKAGLQYRETDNAERLIALYKQLYQQRTRLKPQAYATLKQLSSTMLSNGRGIVREILNPEGELIAGAIFFRDEKRLYQVIACANEQGRKHNAHHYLVDRTIAAFAKTGMVLDFEGSNIPGVAFFNRSFGAYLEPYYFLKWNNLPWPLKLLKQ